MHKFAQLSSADAVYMANRGTTYNRKVSAPTLGANMKQVKAKTTLLASLLRNVKRDAAKDVTVFVIILRFKGEINFFN